MIGAQANGGQCPILKQADRELRPFNPLFHQHQGVQRLGFLVGFHQLFGSIDLADADAGTLAGRLHAQWCAELRHDLLRLIGGRHGAELRRRQTAAFEHVLGAQLVHGQCRRQHFTAGVRDPGLTENRLERAILSTASVQGNKDPIKVRIFHGLQQATTDIDRKGINAG